MLTLSTVVWEINPKKKDCNLYKPENRPQTLMLKSPKLRQMESFLDRQVYKSKPSTEQTTDHEVLVYNHYLN